MCLVININTLRTNPSFSLTSNKKPLHMRRGLADVHTIS